MASFTERIAVIIDVTADKATKGLKDFRTSVQEAEGFTGKMKAGVSSLGNVFSAAASNPAVLAGGIAAAGTAAVKAVDEFAQLALSAGKFSDASGLAIEDASRWMEVAGDLGVNTDSLGTAINKMNRSIDPKLFHDLGIEIARTATGATDVNGTFLNVIQHLHDIPDPAERAKQATKLLGKGWQDMAELIQRGSANLSSSLADVSNAQVISPNERGQAEAYRDTMNQLGDAVQSIGLNIGQVLLPVLELVAIAAAKIAAPLVDTKDELQQIGDDLLKPFMTTIEERAQAAAQAQLHLNDSFREGTKILAKHSNTVDIVTDAEADAANKAATLAERQRYLRDITRDLTDAYSKLMNKLDNADAFVNLSNLFWDLNDGVGDTAQETRDFARAAAELIGKLDELPAQKKIELLTMLDNGKYEEVYTMLDQLRKPINVPVVVGAGLNTNGSGGGPHDEPYPGASVGAPRPAPAPSPPIGRGVDDPTTQSRRGGVTIVQLQLNDKTLQEIAIRTNDLSRGRT